MYKKCRRCKRVLEITQFLKCSRNQDGHMAQCADCRRQQKREYYAKNRERVNEQNKAWAKSHRDVRRRLSSEWNKRNYESQQEYRKRWRKENYGRQRVILRNSHLRTRGIETTVTYDDLMALWQACEGRCRYCGDYAEFLQGEFDHSIPLSLGGTDLLSNLVWSCRTCNRCKHNLLPDEFAAWIRKVAYVLEHSVPPSNH